MKKRVGSDRWWDGDHIARLPLMDAVSRLKVLHEDNHLLAVFKPSGLLTQGPAKNQRCLVDIVKGWLRVKYRKQGNVYAGLIHRLDRPVSGVVIFTKTSKAARRLSERMRKREIRRAYLAVVKGRPSTREGVMEGYLKKRATDYKMIVHPEKKPGSVYARLSFRVMESTESKSLLNIIPLTGRRHQIRALLAHAGMPIWGDCKYGVGPKLGGVIGLLAHRVSFVHPTTKEEITVKSPIPPNWPWP